MEPSAPEEFPRLLTWKGCVGCLGVLALVGLALFWFVYTTCNPPNRVKVTFENVPLGTDRLSVIAESEGELHNMNWFPIIFLVPGDMHPGQSSLSTRDPDDPNREKGNDFVRWRAGGRYGIVTRKVDKSWWVTWFDGAEVPIRDRTPLLGGGRTTFDLAKGQTEAFPGAKVKSLGLDGLE
jgi:hypothetical protein